MVGPPRVTPQLTAKQSQATIISPWPVSNWVAHEMVESVDPIAFMLRILKRAANLCGQIKRDPFVGVYYEDPVVFRLWDRPVLKIAAGSIFARDYPAAELACDLQRVVG